MADVVSILQSDQGSSCQLTDHPVLDLKWTDILAQPDHTQPRIPAKLSNYAFVGIIFAGIIDTENLQVSVCLCQQTLQTHFDPAAGIVHRYDYADQIAGSNRRMRPQQFSHC